MRVIGYVPTGDEQSEPIIRAWIRRRRHLLVGIEHDHQGVVEALITRRARAAIVPEEEWKAIARLDLDDPQSDRRCWSATGLGGTDPGQVHLLLIQPELPLDRLQRIDRWLLRMLRRWLQRPSRFRPVKREVYRAYRRLSAWAFTG